MKQVTDLGAIEKVVDDIVAPIRTRSRRPGKAGADRLVCRPGDEVIRRQGQSASQ